MPNLPGHLPGNYHARTNTQHRLTNPKPTNSIHLDANVTQLQHTFVRTEGGGGGGGSY